MKILYLEKGRIEIHDVGPNVYIRQYDEAGHNTNTICIPKEKTREFINLFEEEVRKIPYRKVLCKISDILEDMERLCDSIKNLITVGGGDENE